MWGKTRKRQEIDTYQAKDRLASVLGLDLEEQDEQEPPYESATESSFDIVAESTPAIRASEPTPGETLEPVSDDFSAMETQLTSAGIEALAAAVRALPERLAQTTEEALISPPPEAQTLGTRVETPSPVDDRRRIVEHELADLSEQSERLLDTQARLFEQKLAGIVTKALAQCEASVHTAISKLEASFAQAKQIESKMGESMSNLAREATEALHKENKILQAELSQLASLIESQVTAGLKPVTSRMHDYRAQADEAVSAIEGHLTQFAEKTAEAALTQTQSFKEKIAAVSDTALSHAQSTVEHRIAQLRETAVRSLGDEITSLSARLERSHSESFERRLDEMFEVAKAKVGVVQQEFCDLSADLLSQMRMESEATAREIHNRLQLDAHTLSSNMMIKMRARLQKLTDEFRSIFDGAAQS